MAAYAKMAELEATLKMRLEQKQSVLNKTQSDKETKSWSYSHSIIIL